MAIPKEHITPRIITIKQKVDTEFGDDFAKLQKPTNEDFALFGRYIQMFAMIELNLRFSVEVFFRASLIKPSSAKKWSKLNSSELVPALKETIAQMPEKDENITESIGKLDEIEFRRSIRNLLAHWAIMRIPGEDAIILFSKDGRDEKQISGQTHIEHNYMRTAHLDLSDIRGLIIHMDKYGIWLAHKAREWRRRYCPEDFD